MISRKLFTCDGSNNRFISDFIIRNEQYARPYCYLYDSTKASDGTEDTLQDGTTDQSNWRYPDNLWVRGTDAAQSNDLVDVSNWQVVDNSILLYTPPTANTHLWLEVATTSQEFGDTLVAPSVKKAEEAANLAVSKAEDASDSATEAKSYLDTFNNTYDAEDVLEKLKTVDGSGSGLDADKLDGINSMQFLRSDVADTMKGTLTIATNGADNQVVLNNNDVKLYSNRSNDDTRRYCLLNAIDDGSAFEIILKEDNSNSTTNITHMLLRDNGQVYINNNKVWHEGNDGTGSGLDADLWDGYDSSQALVFKGKIPDAVDLNNYTVAGLYHQDSNTQAGNGTNFPIGLAGMLKVTQEGYMVYQEYTTYGGNNTTYKRGKYKDTWYDWKEQADLGSSVHNAYYLNGFGLTEASTKNTVVKRNSVGDINARLFRSEYDTTNSDVGFIMTQVDTDSNNYIRPSTPAQVVDALPASNLLERIKLVDGSGSGLDADKLDGLGSTDFIRDNNTETKRIGTSGIIQSGRGNGGAALTVQDGYGDANVTFNHIAGNPEVDGSSGRIAVNTTDDTNATMTFGLKTNVTGGTNTALTTVASLSETLVSFPQEVKTPKLTADTLFATNLPTSDPQVANQIWNDNGTLKISAG